jgi:PAS domain S-box-containing protein
MSAVDQLSPREGRFDEPVAQVPLERVFLSVFLENIPDLIYFKDRASRFIAASRSKALRHGLSSAEALIGRTDFDLFSETHAKRALQDEERIMQTGQPMLGKLEKVVWPDGHETWVVTNKLPLHGDDGEVIGTFGLSRDVTETKRIEFTLEKAHQDLVQASRTAGMVGIATGVLNNVSTMLNSMDVSATVIANGLRRAKAESLKKISSLMRDHAADLGRFLSQDPRGRLVPEFIESLAHHAADERARLLQEIDCLQENVDHIKDLITMQQTYAKADNTGSSYVAASLMEDSLRIHTAMAGQPPVCITREFCSAPNVLGEKAKILQILVNLLRHAIGAAERSTRAQKSVLLRVEATSPGRVSLIVRHNGPGISKEDLLRIFTRGFEPLAGEPGFELHSSALAARELHGRLIAENAGAGTSLVLELPAANSQPTVPPLLNN